MAGEEEQTQSKQRIVRIVGVAAALTGVVAAWLFFVGVNPDIQIPEKTLPTSNAYNLYLEAATALPSSHTITPEERKRFLPLFQRALKQSCVVPPEWRVEDFARDERAFGELGWFLAAEGETQLQKGDFRGALQTGLWLMRLGTDLSHGAAERMAFRGMQIMRAAYPILIEALDRVTPGERKNAMRQLERYYQERDTLTEILQQGQYQGIAELRECFHDTNALEFLNIATPLRRMPLGTELIPTVATGVATLAQTKTVVLNHYQEYRNRLVEWARRPYREGDNPPEMPPDAAQPDLYQNPLRFRRADDDSRTRSGMLLLIFALATCHDRNDRYPMSLPELVAAKYLKELPVDPYTGEPFRYKSISADQYVLYSIGPDGKDDGGLPGGLTGRGDITSGSIAH